MEGLYGTTSAELWGGRVDTGRQLGIPRACAGGLLCLPWARGSGQRPLLPTPKSSHAQLGSSI